ncbi:potassium transporter [Schizopora paradoxa]|uniref:Potassium transporter n=1 Tax=Schizopora paradoxa TaxID=27342 RepID=A0A0H2R316_9AGAM|nr:potassium transporter [Schizopora paradoxa]
MSEYSVDAKGAASDAPEDIARRHEPESNFIRVAPKLTGLALLTVSFQTLGIIYSDIGTSPLYVLNGIWPPNGPVPSEEDVIGGLSAIVWSLTLLPLIKYVFICLRFGTSEGEGGTFALYHGLYPPKVHDVNMDRTLTGETLVADRRPKKSFMNVIRWPLLIWALFGTSLTLADGILTPAVSVTSAVAGIAVAKESVAGDVVPISIAFLVALFLVQRVGTSRLAFLFAPVTFIWLSLLAITGIVNITHHPGIFRAFDPSRLVLLFTRTKDFSLLSGVLLAVTGCEALFANLGQFNALSIQIAFGGFVYPSLVLAYLGQGARLISDGPDVLENVFYLTIPGKANGPLFWVMYVFAILATLIASQAMITATFSLIQQVIHMKSLPPIRMQHTSDKIQGQIYVPLANWILMVATIIFVAAFKSSVSLSNAYGFAVATVMFTTTVLVSFQIKLVKRKPLWLALAFFIPFSFFDGIYWAAALKKVPQGAWVPLMIGCILCITMTFWTWAKGLEDRFDGKNRKNLRHFIMEDEHANIHLLPHQFNRSNFHNSVDDNDNDHALAAEHDFDEFDRPLYYVSSNRNSMVTHSKMGPGGAGEFGEEKSITSTLEHDGNAAVEEKKELVRINTCAIFHKLTPGRGVPHSFIGFVRQWPSLPRVVIFLSVHVIPIARVAIEDRYQVTKVRSVPGFYGVTYCLGFRDDFEVKVDEVIRRICELEMNSNPGGYQKVVHRIKEAAQVSTHIVPHYHVVSKPVTAGRLSIVFSYIRSTLLEGVYRPVASMFPETGNWLGSADEIIHVGINAVI